MFWMLIQKDIKKKHFYVKKDSKSLSDYYKKTVHPSKKFNLVSYVFFSGDIE